MAHVHTAAAEGGGEERQGVAEAVEGALDTCNRPARASGCECATRTVRNTHVPPTRVQRTAS